MIIKVEISSFLGSKNVDCGLLDCDVVNSRKEDEGATFL
jgi:hypothetical protein